MQRKDFSSLGFRMLIGAVLITAVQLASQSVIFGNKPEWAKSCASASSATPASGTYRARTYDPLLVRQMLSQLS